MSSSLQPYELYPARLLCPWDFPGKNTGVAAISYSRGSSRPRDLTGVSCVLAGEFFTTVPWGEAQHYNASHQKIFYLQRNGSESRILFFSVRGIRVSDFTVLRDTEELPTVVYTVFKSKG